MTIKTFNRLRCINAFLGMLVTGFTSPAIIKIQGTFLEQSELTVLLLFVSMIETTFPILAKMPNTVKIFLPSVSSIITTVVIIIAIYCNWNFIVCCIITLYPVIGVAYHIRCNYISEKLKNHMNLEDFSATMISVSSIGSILGLGISYICAKLSIEPIHILLISNVIDIVIIPIDFRIAFFLYNFNTN